MNRRQFLGTAATGILAGSAAAEPKLSTRPSDARFIWYDDQGQGRNLFGLFRRTFDVSGPVQSAVLNVFADTAYQLFVNGEFVEFGPVRFDPRFPPFDTHDIAHLLKPGRNVVAIEVNHFGLHTFKSMPARAGMIAWGSVEAATGPVVSLTTGRGLWRATASKAHTRYASALSFALNAADLYDQSGELEGWKDAAFDDTAWPMEIALARQDSWGPLEPRSIPFMGREPVPVSLAPVIHPLVNSEEWYSFSVPSPHGLDDDRSEYAAPLLFSTFIYSPRAQAIHAGVFYGEHWLNGKPAAKVIPSDRPMRYTQLWQLNQGWNHLFGRVKRYHDRFDQYFAVPRGLGLVFSAERDANSPHAFKHTRALATSEFDQALKSKPVPFLPDDEISEAGGWVRVRRDEPAQAPCRETSWDEYGDPVEHLEAGALAGHVFRLEDYPHGFALLLDLESMHLFFPRIRMEGVHGATVDITYSERLDSDGAHEAQFSWYPLGDRVLCSRDSIDWFPSQPRGTRYLQLTVRNPHRDVTLRSLSLRGATYSVEKTGRFACSDPALNDVWEMCRRTEATSMEDAYIDCAGRERGLYIRDMVIQYHNNLALYGDQALMGRCLQIFGQSPDPTGRFRIIYPNTGQYTHNDFALNAVEGYRAYYEHSGDVRRIRDDWDAIAGNMRFFDKISDEREDRLMAQREVMGGFQGDPAAPKTQLDPKGINCLYSCSYLLALQSADVLAHAIGRTRDAERMAGRIAILKRSIPATFWDASEHCFSDTPERRTHSIHSNLFAVRAGVVGAEQMEGVRAHVSRELRSPFVNGYDPSGGVLFDPSFAFFLFDGLYRAGLPEVVQNLIRQGWGFFLARGLKTCPEFFSREGSLSHAWSASPVYYLSKYLLGVHYPHAPDLSQVEIRVQAHDITSAEGVWPHPDGPIEVKWRMENGRRVFTSLKAPRGVTIRVTG